MPTAQAETTVRVANDDNTLTVDECIPRTMKRFRILGRDEAGILEFVRAFLVVQLRLYKTTTVFQKTGGQSGDLGREFFDCEVYVCGRGEGSVYLYSVVDDSTNGYMQTVSILTNLPEGSEITQKLLQCLDSYEFTASHTSFKERPFGYHSYRQYLDEMPSLHLHETFGNQKN